MSSLTDVLESSGESWVDLISLIERTKYVVHNNGAKTVKMTFSVADAVVDYSDDDQIWLECISNEGEVIGLFVLNLDDTSPGWSVFVK